MVQPVKNRRRLVTRVVERLGLMKIPILGLVVNRTGSEEDHGYYGYHGYGYGYGYGYGVRLRTCEATPAMGTMGGQRDRARRSMPAVRHSGDSRRGRTGEPQAAIRIPRRVA